ncbi:hypothetical protein REH81_17375 [Vibrio rotiferianus]
MQEHGFYPQLGFKFLDVQDERKMSAICCRQASAIRSQNKHGSTKRKVCASI